MAGFTGASGYQVDSRSRIWQRLDGWLILSTVLLIAFGLIALYSYGAHANSGTFLRKQVLNIIVGLVPMGCFLTFSPSKWQRFATPLYVINLIGLVAIFRVGMSKNGAARWIDLGPLQFQPSEMAKLVLIITLASFYAMRRDQIKDLSTFLLGLLHVGVPMVLVLKQPHVGGALVLLVIWTSISLASKVPARYLIVTGIAVLCMLGAMVAFPKAIPFLKGYHDGRISAFTHMLSGDSGPMSRSEKDILMQTNEARTAFGVGGLVGTGLGKGEQGQNVPEQETDFIFTAIGEELGLVGCTLVLMTFGLFFYRIWLITLRATDPFERMMATGILGMLAFHTFVNLFMVTQMLPVIGLWLPFMSYGGTAMWLCMCAVGLVINIRYRERPILFT